jgi:membrane protease subunit (stomatin/prohibitin family)
VASRYPYESDDGANLKNDTDEVSDKMTSELQEKVGKMGVEVNGVLLTDLNYAPEVARDMLLKQQAKAFVEAKKLITDGAVSMVEDVLERVGDNFDDSDKAKLTNNLLTVLTSGSSAQTVIPLES